jgi:hypothetical protein
MIHEAGQMCKREFPMFGKCPEKSDLFFQTLENPASG